MYHVCMIYRLLFGSIKEFAYTVTNRLSLLSAKSSKNNSLCDEPCMDDHFSNT